MEVRVGFALVKGMVTLGQDRQNRSMLMVGYE